MNMKSIILVMVIAVMTVAHAGQAKSQCEIKDGVIYASNPFTCMRELNKPKTPFRNAGLINLAKEAKHNG